MINALGLLLAVSVISITASNVYKNHKLKKNNPQAYNQKKAAKRQRQAAKRKQQKARAKKAAKQAVETIAQLPVAITKAGVNINNQINATVSAYLYGQSEQQTNKNSMSRR